MLYRPAEACWRSCAFPGRPEPFAPSASTTAVTDRRPSHEGYRCLVAKAVETIRSGGLNNARLHHAKALTGLYQPGRLLERITLYFPAAVRARPQPGRARLEHCQKQYREHPARDPRTRPSEHSPHTSPDAPSTTTSNTYPNPDQKPILFYDRHRIRHTRGT